MTSAKILLDSLHPKGNSRLITAELTYQRFIHAELMTHRAFSRNAASSRAIPLRRSIDAALHYPAGPYWWGKNQAGMQAEEALTGNELRVARGIWAMARTDARQHAKDMEHCHVHKQIANRVLEPYLWITVIVTSEIRGLSNFFAQRAHPAAQPEFQFLAYRFAKAVMDSSPTQLPDKGWHIPYGDRMPDSVRTIEEQLQIATARCARVSYMNHNGDIDVEDDKGLFKKLKDQGHWSPFEHCAQAVMDRLDGPRTGNFGPYWYQYRKQFVGEFRDTVNLETIYSQRPQWIRDLEAQG